ncbi:MAG: hypothetical protein R3A79_29030 [Nannocystaceae bacterium]
MGLFRWIFGRKGAGQGEGAGAGAGAGAGEDAGLGSGAAPRVPTLPPGSVVVGPRSALLPLVPLLGAREVRRNPDDDGEFEVRGAVAGRPARVVLDDRPWMSIELKGSFGARMLVLCRDPSKVPKHGEADDPWDDGEVRAFVARGIYVEGAREHVDSSLRILAALAEETRVGLLRALGRLFRDAPVALFCAAGEQLSLAGGAVYVDAAAEAEEALAVLVEVAAQIEATPDPVQAIIAAAQAGIATAAPQVASCDYCGSRYAVAWEYACPNCGAPYRG